MYILSMRFLLSSITSNLSNTTAPWKRNPLSSAMSSMPHHENGSIVLCVKWTVPNLPPAGSCERKGWIFWKNFRSRSLFSSSSVAWPSAPFLAATHGKFQITKSNSFSPCCFKLADWNDSAKFAASMLCSTVIFSSCSRCKLLPPVG